MPAGSSHQSVVEYLISLPDAATASPVVQCIVDGVVLPNSLLQSAAIVLPEDIRPYPTAERAHSLQAVKRINKAKSSTLITGSSFKAQLFEKCKTKGASKRQVKKQMLLRT